jgi:hypothetical protein
MTLANLNLDELAAVDTIGGYGDVGSVPFDTVSALVGWPDGASEAAMLTTGQGGPAASVTCPQQQVCSVTIQSGGHTPAEEAPASPAAVNVSLGYVPADGVSLAAFPAVSVSDAALSLVKLRLERTHTPKKAQLTLVFADADPAGLSSDFTVTITWGDASTSVVVAKAVTGGFSARASHVYSTSGPYKVDVGVVDAGGAALAARRWITVG